MNNERSENREAVDPRDDSAFEQLVRQARAGDQNAAGVLINRFRNYLLLIANEDIDQDLKTKLGASDAVQESIMHAQVNFGQFQGSSEQELKAWLRAILSNDIRKGQRRFNARKRDSKREINIQDQSAVGRRLTDEQLTPSTHAVRQEREKVMTEAMSKLTDDQQRVIQLRNFDQMGFEAIGEAMDRSPDAARKLWARSIEALKNALQSISPELMSQSEPVDDHE